MTERTIRGDMCLHILRVPTEVRRTVKGSLRWCFRCHKHSTGTFSQHVPTDPMSYYDPHWSYRCDNCRQDGRLGFGRYWINGAPGPTSRELRESA